MFDHMFDSGQSESHPRRINRRIQIVYLLIFGNYYGSLFIHSKIESLTLFHSQIMYRFKISTAITVINKYWRIWFKYIHFQWCSAPPSDNNLFNLFFVQTIQLCHPFVLAAVWFDHYNILNWPITTFIKWGTSKIGQNDHREDAPNLSRIMNYFLPIDMVLNHIILSASNPPAVIIQNASKSGSRFQNNWLFQCVRVQYQKTGDKSGRDTTNAQ